MKTDHSQSIRMQSLLCAFSSPSTKIPAISLIRGCVCVVFFPALRASEACNYRWCPRILPSWCNCNRRILAGTRRDHDGSQVRETTVPRSSHKDQSFLRSWPDWDHRILAGTYRGPPDSSHLHDRVPTALVLDIQANEAAVLRPTQQDRSPWASWHDPNWHVFARVCRDPDSLKSPNHFLPAVSVLVNFRLGMDIII